MLSDRNRDTEIDANETVVLYPTFAHLDEEMRTWHVRIRGSVHEPAPDTLRRKILLRLLRRAMKVKKADLDTEIFRRRIHGFLVASERGKRIRIRVGSRTHILKKKTRRNGHFSGMLHMSVDEVEAMRESGQMTDGWLPFHVVTDHHDDRAFSGCSQLIDPRGISVISDIDDTIKHSEVTERQSLLTNTFLKEFESVPGMVGLYQRWAEQEAAFHYVSSSPWQLYDCLAELCELEGFPAGTFHLRAVRLRDPTVLRLFVTRRLGKRRMIRSILKAFPGRQFFLVGDSGEKDPEIYGSVARKCPNQVVGILIRNVTDAPAHEMRYEKAFRRLPDDLWSIFNDPAEIAGMSALV
jgi:phosphatidate phosphatase APP1